VKNFSFKRASTVSTSKIYSEYRSCIPGTDAGAGLKGLVTAPRSRRIPELEIREKIPTNSNLAPWPADVRGAARRRPSFLHFNKKDFRS